MEVPKVKYEVVQDKGGNFAPRCLVCGGARWFKDFEPINIVTGLPCPNCILIQEQKIVEKVQREHGNL